MSMFEPGRVIQPGPPRHNQEGCPGHCRLFPLPLMELPEAGLKCSRRSAQKRSRDTRQRWEMNEAIRSLNWMHGYSFVDSSTGLPNPLQKETYDRLFRLVMDAGSLGELQHPPTLEAALSGLLQGRTDYSDPSCPISLAPYNLELISLPSSLKEAPRAEDLLAADDRRYLEEQERIVRRDFSPDQNFSPYWDPALKNNPRNYRKFLQKLNEIDYLDFTLSPLEHAGVFFVWKSDRKRIRMIVDGRGANMRFHDPPSVALSTAETFSKIELEIPQEFAHDSRARQEFLQQLEIHVGLSDVKDCFHRIKQPRWLARYFCFMPVEARFLGLTGKELEGRVLQSSDMVFPMPGSLCMGCSWSLFFAQRINERQLSLTSGLEQSTLISDRTPPLIIHPNSPGQINHYVYVDNLGIIGQKHELVETGLTNLQSHFNDKQLLLHPGSVESGEVKALGVCLDGQRKRTRITPERFHKVRQAIRGLIRRGRCSGKTLEIVLGHATYCALGCRLLLSIFHTVYKFLRKNYNVVSKLWASVIEELRCFAGLMIFIDHEWGKGWNPMVSSSDASEYGFGICTSQWDPGQVSSVGRISERSRFRRIGGHNARESALSSAGFSRDPISGQWVVCEGDGEDFLNQTGWEIDHDFHEVPAHLLRKDNWQVKQFGQWKRSEHIMVLEARALTKSLERIAFTKYGKDVHQLLLTDSLSMALAFERARSKSFKVLLQIRRFAAVALARNITPHLRWIPSELNAADEPSRLGGESKTLIDLIPPTPHGTKAGQNATNSNESRCPPSSEKAEDSGTRQYADSEQKFHQSNLDSAFPSKTLEEQPVRYEDAFFGGGETSERGDSGPTPQCRPSRLGFKQQFNRRQQGKPPREAFEGKKEETHPAVHGRLSEIQRHKPFLFGISSRHWKDRSLLPDRMVGAPGFLPTGKAAHYAATRPRRGPCALHEPSLHGGASISSRRQDISFSAALQPKDGPSCPCTAPSCCAGTQGLASISPWTEPEGLAVASVGSSGSRVCETTAVTNGLVYDAGVMFICTTCRAFGHPQNEPGATYPSGHRVLVSLAESLGIQPAFEDCRVRQLSPHRHQVHAPLGKDFAQGTVHGKERGSSLGLHLCRVHSRLSQSDVKAEDSKPHTIPVATLRFFDRHGKTSEDSWGNPEKRPVEELQERHSLRESGKTGRKLCRASGEPTAPLSRMRVTARGCDAGPYQAPDSTLRRKFKPRRYVADLFSGDGGVARQIRRLGFCAKEWDINHGPQFDLTIPRVLKRLLSDIHHGRILAMMMAPPCTTFSVARDRTKIIRSRRFPWGLPKRFLTSEEHQKVVVGNKCFQTCFELIDVLQKSQIPWILENPASSKCWFLPKMQQLMTSPACNLIITDFCQYNTRWRKRTALLTGNLDLQDCERLQRRCSGPVGWCSKTGCRHWQLTGSHHGIPWTRIAQPYPKLLCQQLAFVLTAPSQY